MAPTLAHASMYNDDSALTQLGIALSLEGDTGKTDLFGIND